MFLDRKVVNNKVIYRIKSYNFGIDYSTPQVIWKIKKYKFQNLIT